MKIELHRKAANGDAKDAAVRGVLRIETALFRTECFDTLENAKYIIPAGTYGLTVTYSPKFKRLMPVLQGVRGRRGIRIHRGTLPEHSLGCILVKSRGDEAAIADIIGTTKQTITIYDEKT